MSKKRKPTIEEVLDAPSLYPELPRKSRAVREADLLEWQEKYCEVNATYNLYGLDLEGAPPCEDYLDRGIFGRRRYLFNSDFRPLAYPDESRYSYSYAVLGRDKLAFDAFLEWALGSRRKNPVVGALLGGRWFTKEEDGFTESGNEGFCSLLLRHEGGKLVFKTAFGAGAHGVRVVTLKAGRVLCGDSALSPSEFFDELARSNMNWAVQEYLVQHADMARLNGSSVNTMRMVTFNTGTRVVLAPQVALRIGRPGSQVDNESYYTYVDSSGRIDGDAFSFFDMARRPVPLAGSVVPHFERAQKLVVRLHGLLPGLFTIGWDVAIAEDGPAIIEANDGWEPFLSQTRRGAGMRALWDEMETERIGNQGYEPCEASQRS